MGQFELGDFGDDDGGRPADEAAAVAGDDPGAPDVVDADSFRYPDAEGEVTITVTQVDYTVEGRGDDEYPVVHVFGRTDDRELEHVEVYDFKPYFYAPAEGVDDARLSEYDRITGYEETDADGEPYESIRGERLVKIFGQTPRDVGQIRDDFEHFEADILFPNRFLIDKDVQSGVRVPDRRADDGTIRVPHDEVEPVEANATPRVNTFDIEVDDRRGFPEDGEEPIVCLTSHDSYRDEYVAWLFDPPEGVDPPGALESYEPIEDDFEADVRVFEEEEAMLEAFVEYLRDTDADIWTGWNFADFDAPYLLDRMEELQSPTHEYDLDIDRLSRVDEVWRSDWQGPDVKGRVVFDLLRAYKATKFTELESYRLDAVGEQELGVGKERYPGDIGDLWEEDPERLLEYNLRDVELCVELDRKQDIVAFFEELASFVGCKLEDAPTAGDAVDMYVLHKAHGEFALPSKGTVESGEEFEGGAVFDPITGVRENVSVLDLKCFSEDTEILTPEGRVPIDELEVGDPVYTLDPDTFECVVSPVAETHEYDNRFGRLHHLSGNTHDFKITPNHRFLISATRGWDTQKPDDFEFVEYSDITESRRFAFPQHEPMGGDVPERFSLVDDVEDGYVVVYYEDDLRSFRNDMPAAVTTDLDLAHGSSETLGIERKVGKYLLPVEVFREHREVVERHADHLFLKYAWDHQEVPLSFEMEDWLKLLGWYVTEGSTHSDGHRVTIHQDAGETRASISELLDRMGLTYSVDDRGVNLSNAFLCDWLEDNCGEGYAGKRLPEWVRDLDAELLEPLLDTLVRADGEWVDSGLGKFWTKSDSLREDVVQLAVRCGHKPTVSKQSDGTWYVSVGKRGSFRRSTNESVESHDGTVHCITAEENHVVLAGRNGNFQWVGQSLYPMCMWTVNASPETKVDPEEYDGDTYRTPTGQHFRAEPAGMMREMIDELLSEREEKKDLRDRNEPGTPEYERYDRQQASVKVVMNCFTPDTEVLTPDGVRNIRNLEVGDDVYSIDPDTMEMEVKPVTGTHAYPEYEGELVDIETDKIDFNVTPNHRMLVRKNDTNGITEDTWGFVEASDLYDYCHYELPHDWEFDHQNSLPDTIDVVELAKEHTSVDITLSDGGTKAGAKFGQPNIDRKIDADVFLEFLAWFISEGSTYTAKTKNYRVKIAQENPENIGRIESLFDGLTDYYYTNKRGVRFSSRLWKELLDELCGSKSESKKIPELVFRASKEQKEQFLQTLIEGDGDRQVDSWRYSTTSERLRDDVLRLCAHLGQTASYNYDSGTWRIFCTEDAKNSFRMYRSGNTNQAENGVYCVSVKDNETLLAGRNGKYQFTGNSLYGVSGWDRFRLYDKDSAAAVTATGREVISYTQETVSDFDYDVIYGDSVTGDRPVVVRDPDGTVRILPIADVFETATPTAGSEIAVTTDGGVTTAVGDPKDRRELEGWEALSLSADGDAQWQPIEQVIRHESEKGVVKLQHKFGESATTRDHSYVVEEGERYEERTPDEVDSPLRIPAIPDVGEQTEVDVYEVLRGYTREYEDGRSVGAENAETKAKRVHADDEFVWFGHEHHRDQSKTVRVRRHVDLADEEGRALVRLLAAYVSEGSSSTVETTSSRFGASISEERREWLEGLQDDYHRLFDNATASIVESDSESGRTVEYETGGGESSATYTDTTRKLQMMNELAAVFFREFAGQTSRGKRIPPFVFHLPDDLQDLFLDVLVEGDGSREFPRYTEEYAERNFEFETTSRRLAAGLSVLLTQRGQKHSLNYRDSKGSYTVRTCDWYREGRDPVLTDIDHDGYVYDLSVRANDNFVDAVGGIVLHNTDSVMLEIGSNTSKEQAIEDSFELEDRINDSYDAFARERLDADDHRFEIEFEKLYRRFFQAGKKKRYAGHIVWKEGKDVDDIDITGFEYQRSDIAQITKEVQREVIEMIVHGEDLDDVKEYVHGVIEDFREGEVSLDEVGIPGGIGKKLDAYDTDTAQVRGAKYANLLLGTNFASGSKPKRLYLETVHPDFFERMEAERGLDPTEDPLYGQFKREVSAGDGVICFEFADQVPEEFVVDWDKMLDKTLKGPIARVLEALDVSWQEVKSGQEQTGLGQYM